MGSATRDGPSGKERSRNVLPGQSGDAQLILATATQTYEVRIVPEYPVIPEILVTLRPCNGIQVTLQPRK
ncbi:hypothetical protein KDA_49110 [Dictyobacter alpinus]|uniref:Uncharacterized protein n=1 Tax=Dictyobacter alpinus TaxID=2014873 RepID=A0A402BDU4_9CHLR|nr:hypothetical protein KDA_49110 [Dictyobacter alpinus]